MPLNYNLNKFYDITNGANVVRIQYDIGSVMPYDDVWSSTKVISTSGLSVTAKAITTARNNSVSTSDLNQRNVIGWVDSGQALVGGQDYAKSVRHEGYRKFIGGTEVETTVYDIY